MENKKILNITNKRKIFLDETWNLSKLSFEPMTYLLLTTLIKVEFLRNSTFKKKKKTYRYVNFFYFYFLIRLSLIWNWLLPLDFSEQNFNSDLLTTPPFFLFSLDRTLSNVPFWEGSDHHLRSFEPFKVWFTVGRCQR